MFDTLRKSNHERLMRRMASLTGSDLGHAPHAVQEAALEACCGCGHVGSCEDWQEDHADGAKAAPSFCANRAVMGPPGA